jgi:HPt (histidine-containing phosphotransfer) domain-containing protein
VGLVKKNIDLFEPEVIEESEKGSSCINLDHLRKITKSNPLLMAEMISLYLEQTPPLINTMKQSMRDNDLNLLYSAVHKMLPSFSIVGIDGEIEKMARKIQDYARTQQPVDGIPDMVDQLSKVCSQACIELREELNLIRNSQVKA